MLRSVSLLGLQSASVEKKDCFVLVLLVFLGEHPLESSELDASLLEEIPCIDIIVLGEFHRFPL